MASAVSSAVSSAVPLLPSTCGVELSSPIVACVAARSRACGTQGRISLSTVTHSSTYSRCSRRI
jgi:hypothetical protein